MTDNGRTRLEIWNCRGCDVVHVAAGSLRLDLTREEFEVFTESVVGIYCGQFPGDNYLIERSFEGGMEVSRGLLTSSEVH